MDSHEPAVFGRAFQDDGWTVARFCGPNGGNCVEVNLGVRGVVGVRDSKPVAGPVLAFGGPGWGAFLTEARSGRWDGR